MTCKIIPFPQELRPALPVILGNADYLSLRKMLEQIDALLREGGVEKEFVELALKGWSADDDGDQSCRQQLRFQEQSRRALRCTILRTLVGEDYRGFTRQLAGHSLYQWFCEVGGVDRIQVPSKSQLQRYANWLSAVQMREVMDRLLKSGMQSPKKLGLKEALNVEEYFVDSTCLKSNIHFPVDGVRTLMKLFGHVFSGRYKALVVDGSGNR